MTEWGGVARRGALVWMAVSLLVATPAHAGLQVVTVLTQAEGTREEAKERALELAKGRAILQVAQKLDPGKARMFVAKLDKATAETLIRGVSVVQEQRIEQTYFAKVRVTVVDGPIRRAYGEVVSEDIADHVPKHRTLLVLPVFFDGTEPVVWDPKGNPTFPMWVTASFEVAQGAFVVPKGVPTERAIVDRDNVLTVPYEELKPLFADYGADEMAIVVVNDMLPVERKDELQVVIRRVREDGDKIERFPVKPSAPSPKRDVLYAEAVHQAAERLVDIASETSGRERDARAKAQKVSVMVQFTTLRDWGIIQEKLRRGAGFAGLDIRSLKLHEAAGTLYISEKTERYLADVKGQGLMVEQVGANLWKIRSR